MFNALESRFVPIASALALALAAPATAKSDIRTDEYNSSIQGAKRAMVTDPAKALDLARKAKGLKDRVKSEVEQKDRLVATWLEGEALLRLNRSKEAAGIIGFALFEASQYHQDDRIYADLLRSSASLKASDGDPREALDHFTLAAERYEELGDKRSLAIVLQNIGSLYWQADDFPKVLEYYRMAADVFSEDAVLSLSAHNNIGNALKGLHRYDEAEQQFDMALAIAREMQSPLLEARILTNLASTQHRAGNSDIAEQNALQALALAKEHATDWTPFIYGVLAQIEVARGDLETAETFITLTFQGQDVAATHALFREFHDTASEVFRKRGKEEQAIVHSAASKRLIEQAQRLAL